MGFKFANVHGITRYPLSEIGPDVWIEVRDELTVGEKRKMFRDAVKGQTPLDDGRVRTEYDMAKLSFSTVLAYVTDWSEKTALTASAIEALDEEDFAVIERVVEEHIKAKKSQKAPRIALVPKTTTEKTPPPSDEVISSSVAG